MRTARLAAVLLAVGAVLPFLPSGNAAPVPKPVADFTLTDAAGKPWKLSEQKAKAIVLVFLSTDCPMSNSYLPVLADVAAKYADQGVSVAGVFADPETTAAQLAAHAKEYKIAFPLLRDEKQTAAAAVGAKVTPEAFVLDAARAVRYRGRIDDKYTARLKARPIVTRNDLTAALDELLADKPVSVPETKAFGCPVPELEPEKKPAVAASAVTFHKDVLPILQNYCQDCHRPEQVGPFSLLTYKQAAKWADTCLEEVQAKRMPPWKPEPNALLKGTRAVPAEAVTVLERWVAQGMPEGDPKDAPPARTFDTGWALGEPDLILEAPEDMIVGPTGRDLFRVMVFPTNLPEDKYIVATEVKPGNPRVVHHTLHLLDTTGQARKLQEAAAAKQKPDASDRGPGYTVGMGWGFRPEPVNMAGGWAPGILPKRFPDGIGQKLPKGADYCVQIHFHRTGREERERTRIGLYFAPKPAVETYRSIPITGVFAMIPAGEKEFKVHSAWKLTADATLYRIMPHMHLLGKTIELGMIPPNGGKEQTLLRISEWDYNWQEEYDLKEPMKLPKGTVLIVRATFDNSAGNPNNPNPVPRAVRFGEQTTDEMCFVFLGVSTRSTDRRLVAPAGLAELLRR